jgi:hypothetical protein
MDSFVHQAGGAAEEIYGDEGVGGLPPLFGFSQRSRIDAGIQGIRAEGLTTGHGSVMPSAWGYDEFIAPPGEWVYSGRNQYSGAPDQGIDVTALLAPLIAQEAVLLPQQAQLQQNITALQEQIDQFTDIQGARQMLNEQMASITSELSEMNSRIGQVNDMLGMDDEDLPVGVTKSALRGELNHLNGLVGKVNKQMNGVTEQLNNLSNAAYVNGQIASLSAQQAADIAQLSAVDAKIAEVRAAKVAIYSSANLN